jgi:hypothetical protein
MAATASCDPTEFVPVTNVATASQMTQRTTAAANATSIANSVRESPPENRDGSFIAPNAAV